MTIAKTQFLYWYGNKKSALLFLQEIIRNLKTLRLNVYCNACKVYYDACKVYYDACKVYYDVYYNACKVYYDACSTKFAFYTKILFLFLPEIHFPLANQDIGITWGYLPLLQHQVVDWKFHNIKLTKLELVLPSFKNIENKGHGTTIEVTSSEFRLPNALRKKTYLRIFFNDKN